MLQTENKSKEERKLLSLKAIAGYVWPFNNSIERRIKKAMAGAVWNKPIGYAVITTESGRKAIVFEKAVNWVAFDAGQIEKLCSLLKGSNYPSSATGRERQPERKEDVR